MRRFEGILLATVIAACLLYRNIYFSGQSSFYASSHSLASSSQDEANALRLRTSIPSEVHVGEESVKANANVIGKMVEKEDETTTLSTKRFCSWKPLTDRGPADVSSGAIQVCVISKNTRQRSLFISNWPFMAGSGKFTYVAPGTTECAYWGRCKSTKSAVPAGCDPENPVIFLYDHVKCCHKKRYAGASKMIRKGLFDVSIVTGDEYCSDLVDNSDYDYRNYHSDALMASTGVKYIPLGPRFEFERVPFSQVKRSMGRKHLFNFVGALSSTDRKKMVAFLTPENLAEKGVSLSDGFIHTIDRWYQKATEKNGYILPSRYREILIDSVFTLCPAGHNVEAYRMYEALEAGSIPIVVRSEYYRNAECTNGFAPLAESKAPFPILESWEELPGVLARAKRDVSWAQEMQCETFAWYRSYMSDVARNLEDLLSKRWSKRMPHEARRRGIKS